MTEPLEPFQKVDLPSGGWATFRDPASLTERQRRPLKRVQMRIGLDKQLRAAMQAIATDGPDTTAVDVSSLSDAQLDLMSDFAEAVTVALTDGWSYDTPVTVDSLQDLRTPDYDALILAAGKHQSALMPNFDDVNPDPASPTEPSTD